MLAIPSYQPCASRPPARAPLRIAATCFPEATRHLTAPQLTGSQARGPQRQRLAHATITKSTRILLVFIIIHITIHVTSSMITILHNRMIRITIRRNICIIISYIVINLMIIIVIMCCLTITIQTITIMSYYYYAHESCLPYVLFYYYFSS